MEIMMTVLEIPALMGIAMPGGSELLLIFLIVLVVFGHNRIPALGEALGKGIRNFKKSFNKDETETEANTVDVQQIPQNTSSTVDEKVEEAVEQTDDSKVG
jgi:sec-independent protein translocase protein TatA